MVPQKIRLIHLKSRTVSLHEVESISWDKVWTVSHIWDKGPGTVIPLEGVSWTSTSFSSEDRFNVIFEKTCRIVEPYGAEYVWMDTACIDQEREEEKKEQVPFMAIIYSQSAGSVAFGTLTPDAKFAQMAYTYDGGQKAWICDWFERVWTYQELQLPKVLLFVSGDHVLRRDEVYISVLMMSPYLTPRYRLPPSRPNDHSLSIQDVLNALSPKSRTNTHRSLMQTSKRSCSNRHINDKVYGMLGVLSHSPQFSQLDVDYSISLEQVVLKLMMLMPPNDVLDSLTFNTLPPENNMDNALHWSGMVRLDGPMEYPPYETDIHHPTNAFVIFDEETSPKTVVRSAPLWSVVVRKPENTHTTLADIQDRLQTTWPSITTVSQYAKLTDDFSKVQLSDDYAATTVRARRSLTANWPLLEPLLEEGARDRGAEQALSSILKTPLSNAQPRGSMRKNRLGDANLFDREVTVLVCRSKEDGLFHYGIVVTRNDDGSWHKVCTASFSDGCVVATSKDRVENEVVIGK